MLIIYCSVINVSVCLFVCIKLMLLAVSCAVILTQR